MDRVEFFSKLPPEIIVDILSRIPFKTVFTCKCVCKSWLGVLETPEFSRSHLSKSVPGLLIHCFNQTNLFRIFEFDDSLEIERHDLHYKIVAELHFDNNFNRIYGYALIIEGSANGLLFMRDLTPPLNHYVCNPITGEYIKLPQPEGIPQKGNMNGFGVSRLSDQYKVVRIFHDRVCDPDGGSLLSILMSVWQVYTLGTGSWRDIPTPSDMLLDYSRISVGKLLNGNLHWLARDLNGLCWISCFDLETEAFTKFRAPVVESGGSLMDIGVFGDRLCLFDNSSETEISMYMMNDGGDEKRSWKKEYVISKIPHFSGPLENIFVAVKAFGDGDILMTHRYTSLSCYSNRTKTMANVDMLSGDTKQWYNRYTLSFVEAMLYIPSFISLKDFKTENAKLSEFVCLMSKG